MLPENIQVFERGWLSSNNILFLEGDEAALIDSGYVTQAEQTVLLVHHALAGRKLSRLLNTHSHSDHIGGNAALSETFGCRVIVPAGIDATIAEWNEEALLLSPLGQSATRFRHDETIAAGSEVELGGLVWRAIPVPGHDMDALAFHNVEHRLLISGDALWHNGFGVIFSELLGHPQDAGGLKAARATLDSLARLSVDVVIPGHGAPFADVDASFERAYRKLALFEQDVELLARHALKVILMFALLEKRQLPRADLPNFLARLGFCQSVNARYLNHSNEKLAEWLIRDLLRAGALRDEDGQLVPG